MKKYIVIFTLAAMICALAGCGSTAQSGSTAADVTTQETTAESTTADASTGETGADESGSADDQSQAETSEEDTVFTFEAFGLELKYPQKWEESIDIAIDDSRAVFSCGGEDIFALACNSDEGYVLGTVCAEENKVISVVEFDFDTEDDDLCAMMEDVNVILHHLMEDYDFAVGEAIETEDTSTIDIVTSVVTMKYPAKWQDEVQIDVSDSKVEFSNDGTALFDLVFEECDGYLLGTYSGTPIYIVDYDVETDEQAMMQEDVNVILQYLMEDKNFVINH